MKKRRICLAFTISIKNSFRNLPIKVTSLNVIIYPNKIPPPHDQIAC